MKIYLAGNLHSTWRQDLLDVISVSGIEWIFPQDIESSLASKYVKYGEVVHDLFALNVVNIDLAIIGTCHALIAFYGEGHLPIGTTCEVFYAWQRNKPIIILTNMDYIMKHPWIRHISSLTIKTGDSFLESKNILNKYLSLLKERIG